jgi:hypothetical protein
MVSAGVGAAMFTGNVVGGKARPDTGSVTVTWTE